MSATRRVGRPGAGGRLPRSSPFTSTSATADLIHELGRPQLEVHGSTQLLLWPVNADGDGIIVGRLSGREVEGGETAMGQIHPLRALANRLGLRPRLIVMGINNSGPHPYAERPDLALIEEVIDLGWCRWVAWHGPDRIARDILPAETFYDLLRRRGVDLYLHGLGRSATGSAAACTCAPSASSAPRKPPRSRTADPRADVLELVVGEDAADGERHVAVRVEDVVTQIHLAAP